MAEFDGKFDTQMRRHRRRSDVRPADRAARGGHVPRPDDRRHGDRQEDRRTRRRSAPIPAGSEAADGARHGSVRRRARVRRQDRRGVRLLPRSRRRAPVPARPHGHRHRGRRLRRHRRRGDEQDPGLPGLVARAPAVPHPPVRADGAGAARATDAAHDRLHERRARGPSAEGGRDPREALVGLPGRPARGLRDLALDATNRTGRPTSRPRRSAGGTGC